MADGVGGVTGGSIEISAPEVTLCFHMADHGLDGGAAPQLALDGTEHVAILVGDEYAVWVWRIVASVSLVDIGALDLAPGEPLGIAATAPTPKPRHPVRAEEAQARSAAAQ